MMISEAEMLLCLLTDSRVEKIIRHKYGIFKKTYTIVLKSGYIFHSGSSEETFKRHQLKSVNSEIKAL